MGFERVDLAGVPGVVVQRRWGCGDPAALTYRTVGLGVCGGRWFVQKTGRSGTLSWLAPDERTACMRVERWIRVGAWLEITEASCIVRG
jgi:hypothetical protein